MTMHVSSTTTPWLTHLHRTAVWTLDRNVVQDADGSYIRAGDGYEDPWTRDAALNSWRAAALLRPDVARATLLRVTEHLPGGRRVIAQDAQWWDQVVWVVAAVDLATTTGDDDLLRVAFDTGTASLDLLHAARFRPEHGLYAGPALMQDGVSGLPSPPVDPAEPTSFVLDQPDAREVMTLSTNCLYVMAMRALADAADRLGRDGAALRTRADTLVDAVRAHLSDGPTFGYLRHGSGPAAGALDHHREAAGLALAVLSGVVPPGDAAAALQTVPRGPAGFVVNVAPHFAERYSDEHPGRHNAMCWPMVLGLVGSAAAAIGDGDGVRQTLDEFRRLVDAADGRFDEVHDAMTGAPDGGWQCGFRWDSERNQTWSATSFLRLVHGGLLGITPRPGGWSFRPVRPGPGDVLSATGLPFGSGTIDCTVRTGDVPTVVVDGLDVTHRDVHLPFPAGGQHTVTVTVAP